MKAVWNRLWKETKAYWSYHVGLSIFRPFRSRVRVHDRSTLRSKAPDLGLSRRAVSSRLGAICSETSKDHGVFKPVMLNHECALGSSQL